MTNQEKLQELYNLKRYIESKEFQEYIMKPLYQEIDELKASYDCESLRELAAIKGKKQGLHYLIKRLKIIDTEIKNLKFEIEDSASEKL